MRAECVGVNDAEGDGDAAEAVRDGLVALEIVGVGERESDERLGSGGNVTFAACTMLFFVFERPSFVSVAGSDALCRRVKVLLSSSVMVCFVFENDMDWCRVCVGLSDTSSVADSYV